LQRERHHHCGLTSPGRSLVTIPVMNIVASLLLLHGGRAAGKHQADLFVLDVNTQIWKKFFVFDQPPARSEHTLTKIGNEHYLFGGVNSSGVLDELWALNMDSVAWASKTLELPGIVWEKLQGPGFSTRGHAAVAINSQLVIFGGIGADGECSNTLMVYDT
jgi:N-acetylneuraminic acid mutarotase